MRKRSFASFHKDISRDAGYNVEAGERIPYVADPAPSIQRRMATGCLEEAVMLWALHRSYGHGLGFWSKDVVHIYQRKDEKAVVTPLFQADCALELAWIAAGQPIEWLDAPRDMLHEETERRKIQAVDKSAISSAFAFNRSRGTIAREGYTLSVVPNPEMFCDVTEHFGESKAKEGNLPDWEPYRQRWNTAHPAVAREEQEILAQREELNVRLKKITLQRLSDYRRDTKDSTTSQKSADDDQFATSQNKEPDPSETSQKNQPKDSPTSQRNPPPSLQPLKPLQPIRAAGDSLLASPARLPTEDGPLAKELANRRLLPDGGLLDGLRHVIGDMPLPEFFLVLDERLKHGRIGTGLLMEMAKKARTQWEINAPKKPPAEVPASNGHREELIADALSRWHEFDEKEREFQLEALPEIAERLNQAKTARSG